MHKSASTQMDPVVEPAAQVLSYRLSTIVYEVVTKSQFSIGPRDILKRLKDLVHICLTTSARMNENFKSDDP